MTPAFRKSFWWSLSAASFGASVFFALACILAGPPPARVWWIYSWPAVSTPLMVLSLVKLRREYRDEPGGFTGFWHLSIGDFYATIVFTALLLAAARRISEQYFAPAGAAASVLLGIGFLVCILFATRKGFASNAMKWLSAFGMWLKTLGLMASGLLAVVVIVGGIADGFIDTIQFLISILNVFDTDKPAADSILRFAVLGLPFGILIVRLTNRYLPKQAEAAKQ